MKKTPFFAALTLLFLFSSQVFSKGKIPSWYSQPRQDSLEKLYGVGTGLSMKAAREKAAEDIIGKISTEIQTAAEASQTLSLGTASTSYQSKTQLATEKLRLTNIVVEKSAQAGVIFYVQISVKRDEIIEDLSTKAKKASGILQSAINPQPGEASLDAFIRLNRGLTAFQELTRTHQLLKTLDSFYSPESHQSLLGAYTAQQQQLKDKLTLQIDASDNLLSITSEILKQFQAIGIYKRSTQPDLTVKLTATSTVHEVYGSHVASVQLKLSLLNNKQQIIFEEVVKSNGSSVSSPAMATQMATNKLGREADNLTYQKALGL